MCERVCRHEGCVQARAGVESSGRVMPCLWVGGTACPEVGDGDSSGTHFENSFGGTWF